MPEPSLQLSVTSPPMVAAVKRLETLLANLPQQPVDTLHTFHAGLYGRTVRVPAGTVMTGVLIRIATVLILSGDAVVMTDDGPVRVTGYQVMAGRAGRKQALRALSDTFLTMMFATEATSIAEAEAEFTDECDHLASRCDGAHNEIQGEGGR